MSGSFRSLKLFKLVLWTACPWWDWSPPLPTLSGWRPGSSKVRRRGVVFSSFLRWGGFGHQRWGPKPGLYAGGGWCFWWRVCGVYIARCSCWAVFLRYAIFYYIFILLSNLFASCYHNCTTFTKPIHLLMSSKIKNLARHFLSTNEKSLNKQDIEKYIQKKWQGNRLQSILCLHI